MLEHERIREERCGCRSDVATGVYVRVCASCASGRRGGTVKKTSVLLDAFMRVLYGERWSGRRLRN